MINSPSNESSRLSLPGTAGSRTVSLYTERVMKVFPIYETELNTLAYLNTAATLCFSFGSFFLNEVWTHFKSQGYQWLSDRDLLCMLIFYIFAVVALCYRKSTIAKIKRDSTNIGQNEQQTVSHKRKVSIR